MTVYFWRLLTCISAALFVVVTVINCVLHPAKNTYSHAYEKNEFIKKSQADKSLNEEYFTQGETRKYISKYVICKTPFDKYLVCSFATKFKNVTYYVMQYTKYKRVIDVIKVTEYDTGDASKVVALSRRCAFVNVVIGVADDVCINTDVIRPLSVSKIRLHAFLKSVLMFTSMIVLRQVIQELATGPLFDGRVLAVTLRDMFNYICVGAAALFSLLNYFITVKCMRKKSAKVSGGVCEYDFV